jgi:CRISPR-associated protein Cmr2
VAASAVLVRARLGGTEPALADYVRFLSGAGENSPKLKMQRLRVRSGSIVPVSPPPHWMIPAREGTGCDREVPDSSTSTRRDVEALGSLDLGIFFSNRLPDIVEETSLLSDNEFRGVTEVAQEKLRTALCNIGITGALPPYYALVLADGDNMGRTIKDLAAAAPDETGAMKAHLALGQALDTFAREARGVVESHGGSLIFAGGDDVFALAPLHSVLAMVCALRETFRQSMEPACPSLDPGRRPTLSVGVAIVHHLEPLVDARELVREAEKLAKGQRMDARGQQVSKNALGIILSMRGGGQSKVVAGWDEPLPGGSVLPDELGQWAAWFDSGQVPDSIVFELERALLPFGVTGPRGADTSSMEIVRTLLLRAVARRFPDGDSDATMSRLLESVVAGVVSTDDPLAELGAFTARLRIARVLQLAYRAAWGPPQPLAHSVGRAEDAG